MAIAVFPFTLRAVLFGPFELAIKSVLPLFDLRGGSIIGNQICSTPFLTFAFILFSPIYGAITTSRKKSRSDSFSWLAHFLKPFQQRVSAEPNAASREFYDGNASLADQLIYGANIFQS
jgi:hypothetical protein